MATTKIAFITFGCTLNFADTELMSGLLQTAGFDVVGSDAVDSADVVIVNGCSVKHLAEKKFFKAVQRFEDAGKKIIVAGCVAQAEQEYAKTRLASYSIIGTKQLNKIVHVVEETLSGNIVQLLGQDKNDRLNVPRVRRNPVVGIVPISEGCLGECTYCKSRFARGKLVSYDPDAIVRQVVSDVAEGCKEIWLTSQDCGAYGKDIGTDIVTLLRAVCDVEGNFMVRIGMMNPDFALEHLDDLIGVFKENKDKLFWFLHIPVQAGSDRVLRLMKRKYTVGDFIHVTESIRRELAQFTISTDIICGFPGETEEEFHDSIELVQKVNPDVINISRFWPRPGTEAEKMEGQLPGRDTNKRSREMRELLKRISRANNETWKGWQGMIIIDEQGNRPGSMIGRNFAYKPVAVKGKFNLGETIEVKIEKIDTYHLEGRLVE